MANPAAQQLIAEAARALETGNPQRALELADQVVAIDESIAEGYQIRGIALTKLGQVEEATIALRRATEMAPYEPKHYYNLAVNLRDRGLRDEAQQMAEEALRLDPKHAGARSVAREISGVEPPTEPGDAQPHAPAFRPGYGQQKHLLPFMNGIERAWAGVGYGFLGIALVLAILMITHMPLAPTGVVQKGQLGDVTFKRDAVSVFTVFLYVVSFVCTFMWMFVDLIDSRRKFSWMVPLVICAIWGFNVIPLAIYIFVGRKIEPDRP